MRLDYNMPKQIVNRKETPVVLKQANNLGNIGKADSINNKQETTCYSAGVNASSKRNTMKNDMTASFGSKMVDKDLIVLNESNRQSNKLSTQQAPVIENSKKTVTNLEKEGYLIY